MWPAAQCRIGDGFKDVSSFKGKPFRPNVHVVSLFICRAWLWGLCFRSFCDFPLQLIEFYLFFMDEGSLGIPIYGQACITTVCCRSNQVRPS